MGKVYVMHQDGRTEPMTEIHCTNEDLELQRTLEKTPGLVPGEQINPDAPRQWLIIKREMPVPDPNTGSGRWSIDFFVADQDAMPTFIECKRFSSTQSRREVIGQMLEYAANGHYYWSKDEMRDYAEDFAKRQGLEIEDEFRRLQPDQPDTIDAFFEQIEDNLREGQVRLVFFLEEAPSELKSVVDFLNKQMERTEVLLVEARQYEKDGLKIVVPTLFGYTEEARHVKKTVTVTKGQRKKWNKDLFFADAKERLSHKHLEAVKRIYEKAQDLMSEISWGTGKSVGSFSFRLPQLARSNIISVFSDGNICVPFGGINKTKKEECVRDDLKNLAEEELGLSVPPNYQNKYPTYDVSMWEPKLDQLLSVIDRLLQVHGEERGA
jgi:hypothetical protein